MHCPNTYFLGEICLHKKTFHSLGRSDYQCPQCGSVSQVRNIPCEDPTNSSFSSFGSAVHIFEESLKSIQNVIGDVYCPNKFCLNREICKYIAGYVTTPRSIYGCNNCGAWLFVHKVFFHVTGARKHDKNRQNTLFLCREKMNLVPNKQLILNVPFQSTKYRIKNCVWTTSRLLEMCFVQHVETKSVFTFQPIKRLVFTTAKCAKPPATFGIFLSGTENRQFCCLAVMEHIALQERRVAITKNHLLF